MSSVFTSISINDNITVTYSANKMGCTMNDCCKPSASTICASEITDVMFLGHSLVTFTNDTGGVVLLSNSSVSVKEYSTVKFNTE